MAVIAVPRRCQIFMRLSLCVIIFIFSPVKQGKGLFAKRSIKKGEAIFIERPLVCAQFLWNSLYKYKGEESAWCSCLFFLFIHLKSQKSLNRPPVTACEFCLRALETAEENARRLSGKPGLSLPHPEVCSVKPELHQACPQCQVCLLLHHRKGCYTLLLLFLSLLLSSDKNICIF